MNKRYFFLLVLFLPSLSSKAQWGELDSRTESRADAGLSGAEGAKSGFYQTVNPINFPAGAQGWWHLLDIRHSSISNNYAMQFSGNFYDQQLHFRKTNGNPSQPWSQVLTASSAGILNNNNIIIQTATGQSYFTGRQMGPTYSYESGIFRAITENPNGQLNYFYDGYRAGVRSFYVRADGQGYFAGDLGIGTTTPDSKLTVTGQIHAQEVKVDLNVPGPDYVFDNDYKMKTLVEVESYIAANKHLPEIPSAGTMQLNGIKLSEMNMKLLQKVEELTLYLIENEKKDKEKESVLKMQQSEIDLLKQKLAEVIQKVSSK